MSKKILITGGEGQVGLSLFSHLSSFYKINNTSRLGGINSDRLDIVKASECDDFLKHSSPDIIVNCASYNNVDKCELNKKDAREVIVKGLNNLIKYSNKGCKIIQISSDYIFNGTKKEYLESDNPDPINYYGKLKLEAENLLRSANRKFIILRCNAIFSPFINNKSNFLAWVYNSLKNEKHISVVNDQISNPTPVELICEAINSLIILNSEGIYNIGTLDSISRYDFAIKICKKFGFKEKLIKEIYSSSLNQVAKRPYNTYLNIAKISNELEIDIYSLDYYLNNIKADFYE